jgi:hypothetical protein
VHTPRWGPIALTTGLTVTAGLGTAQAAYAAPGPQVVATVYRAHRAAGRHPLQVGPFRWWEITVPELP